MNKKNLASESSLEETTESRVGSHNDCRQIKRDFEALSSWLDQMITNLAKKKPDSETHLIQSLEIKELFLQIANKWESIISKPNQTIWLIHLLELILWTLQLSVCATIAENREKSHSHSAIFKEISNHLLINFILLRDNLICLSHSRFNSFNECYANLLVYSIIKNFISFYKLYCSWFDDKIYISSDDKPILLNGWEKIRWFLRRLRNKVEHEFNKLSERQIDLKDFDPLLEVDYDQNPEYHPKIGNKVHKYPLAILVMFRFLLKEQNESFDEINREWFSCNNKIYDQFGIVKTFEF